MSAVSTRLRIGTIATVVVGGLLLLAPGASSQSVTPQSVDPWQHFIDCAGVLITAPDVHAANCLPNNIGPEMKSLGSSSDGGGKDCRILDGVEDLVLDTDCGRDDTDNIDSSNPT